MEKTTQRRKFIQSAIATIGTLLFGNTLRAEWDENAYNKTEIVDSIRSIGIGDLSNIVDGSNLIDLNIPEIAENGAIVPVEIHSKIPDTRRIFLFAEKNPQPLVADVVFSKYTEPFFASRVKMGETAFVHVIALADNKFYRTAREVKVTIGGCGED